MSRSQSLKFFLARRRISGGRLLNRLRKLWVVEDLIKRYFGLALVLGLEPVIGLAQLSAPSIFLDLPIPLIGMTLAEAPHEFEEFPP